VSRTERSDYTVRIIRCRNAGPARSSTGGFGLNPQTGLAQDHYWLFGGVLVEGELVAVLGRVTTTFQF